MKIYDFNHDYRLRKKKKGLKIWTFLLVFCFSFIMIKGAYNINAYGEVISPNTEQVGKSSNSIFDMLKEFISDGLGIFFDKDTGETKSDESSAKSSFQEADKESGATHVNYEILVNQHNSLDPEYKPENMKNIAESVSATKDEILLEDRAAKAYIEMVKAMEEDINEKLAAISGYRSYNYQAGLHNAEIERKRKYLSYDEAVKAAAREVAKPGTSEHQLGLAIDVTSAEIGYGLSTKFEYTKAYEWLKSHAHEYGFVVRYQLDKIDITGIIFEPWHLRYLGPDLALKLYETGLSLEEYYDSIN